MTAPSPADLLTPAERRFGWFMLGSGVVYICSGSFFMILPNLTVSIGGLPGRQLGLPVCEAWGQPEPRTMWFALAISMMATIATCCLLAGTDPRRRRPFAVPLLVSKATSTLVAAGALVLAQPCAQTLGVIITDLPIFALSLWVYVTAVRSVNGSWLQGGPPPG